MISTDEVMMFKTEWWQNFYWTYLPKAVLHGCSLELPAFHSAIPGHPA